MAKKKPNTCIVVQLFLLILCEFLKFVKIIILETTIFCFWEEYKLCKHAIVCVKIVAECKEYVLSEAVAP